jgi:hypothetical protein
MIELLNLSSRIIEILDLLLLLRILLLLWQVGTYLKSSDRRTALQQLTARVAAAEKRCAAAEAGRNPPNAGIDVDQTDIGEFVTGTLDAVLVRTAPEQAVGVACAFVKVRYPC